MPTGQQNTTEKERSMVTSSFLQAFSSSYDDVYEVNAGDGLTMCLQARPVMEQPFAPGMRMVFTELMEYWLANCVATGDEETARQFFASCERAVEHSRQAAGEPLTAAFSVVRPSGQPMPCEATFVPVMDDTSLLCFRGLEDGQADRSGRADVLAAMSAGRSFKSLFSHSILFSGVFDADSRKRIRTSADVETGEHYRFETLDDFAEFAKAHANTDDLPRRQEAEDLLGMVLDASPSNNTTCYEFRVTFDGETWTWIEFALLFVGEPSADRSMVYAVIRDIDAEKRVRPDEGPAAHGADGYGILSRQAFVKFCESKRENPREHGLSCQLMLLAIDALQDYPFDEQEDVLETATAVLGRLGRDYSMNIARMYQDTFMLCCHEVHEKEQARRLARIVKDGVDAELAKKGPARVSIGYAECKHDPDQGFRPAHDLANIALQRVRQNGGDGICAFSEIPEQPAAQPQPQPAAAQATAVQPAAPQARTDGGHTVRIRTFGYFEVFVDDEAVLFRSGKAKELLALLVDRKGGFVSSRDAVTCLWEDDPVDKVTLSRFRKVAMHLKNTLEEYGVADIVVNESGQRRLDVSKVECDLYDYLSGAETRETAFGGSYLSNYSWGEVTTAQLVMGSDSPHLYQA